MSHKRAPKLSRVVTATAFALLGSAVSALSTLSAVTAGTAHASTSSAPVHAVSTATALPPVAAPAADPLPGLTVEVLGGGAPATEHSSIDYTIELRNGGSLPYRHLAVSALLPAGFHLVQATPRPGPPAALPTWTTDIAPGQRVDIQARIAAGTLQDLADGTPAPLADAPAALVDASVSGAQAWYSVSACVRRTPADPPLTCGLSSQLLIKTDDDTRNGVDAMVLLLGLPAVAALFGAYAWRARRDPGES